MLGFRVASTAWSYGRLHCLVPGSPIVLKKVPSGQTCSLTRPAAPSSLPPSRRLSSLRSAPSLAAVISLNINYWAIQNPALKNATGAALAEGLHMFTWLEGQLEAAAARGDAVHLLGHQPPAANQEGPGNPVWLAGYYARFTALLARFKGTVKASFWGHMHSDYWGLVRTCRGNETACGGEAVNVMLSGPALTEGYPARNPSVRLLQFHAETLELHDMRTYVADLHEANAKGTPPAWTLAYTFKEKFQRPDLSVASFEALHADMAASGSASWAAHRGGADGVSLLCSLYDIATAPFPPINACTTGACEAGCKAAWIATLNGTNVPR